MSELIIIDLETTASNVTPETEPIEVSFRLIKDENEDFTFCMKPDVPVQACATVIHGLEQRDVDQFEPIQQQLEKIFDIMKQQDSSTIVAAYNAQFDVGVLDQAMNKYIKKRFQPKRVLDILRLAQKLIHVKTIGNYKLDTVYYSLFPSKFKYLQKVRASHSGIQDVALEEEVLFALWGKLEKMKGYEDCSLDELYGFTLKPMLQEDWMWGKHRGEKVLDVVKQDRSYVRWFMTKCDFRDQHPDLVYTLEQLRNE